MNTTTDYDLINCKSITALAKLFLEIKGSYYACTSGGQVLLQNLPGEWITVGGTRCIEEDVDATLIPLFEERVRELEMMGGESWGLVAWEIKHLKKRLQKLDSDWADGIAVKVKKLMKKRCLITRREYNERMSINEVVGRTVEARTGKPPLIDWGQLQAIAGRVE